MVTILDSRRTQIHRAGEEPFQMECGKASLAGAVSQRACVFCGSRVVLYPIADAIHLVHGPIGCAAYTWDIRGALSSGPQLHRLSFSTDLQEMDVIQGGEKKLYAHLIQLIRMHNPKAAFVYATCIVGIIGDDVAAVCKRVANETGIPVISVKSEGFAGTKKDGYSAACEAIFSLVGTDPETGVIPRSINILGDFNLAGETWIIRDYYERMGIEVVATVTGDGRIDAIRKMHRAALNVVQCSGSMSHLARLLKDRFHQPFIRVSYFGIEDTAAALYDVAQHFNDPVILNKTRQIVREETRDLLLEINRYRSALSGKKAAIYVGGAFKAFSLVRALRMLGMQTILVGSQTGTHEDYEQLRDLCDPGTVIIDDANPLELCRFLKEKGCDLFIGGVKERALAYKLGLGFCDHNHERKHALAGFVGMLNFAREVFATVTSPVWRFAPRRLREGGSNDLEPCV